MKRIYTTIGAASLLVLLIIAPMILTAQMESTEDTIDSAVLTPTLDLTQFTPQPRFSPTLDPFPRPTNYEIIVAEQVFENGRMFYLLPADRLWVMFNEEDSTSTQGTWEVYENPFTEGERELDPNREAPDGLHQPIRGFGKIWRDTPSLVAEFGWALDPEIGHFTQYLFFPGDKPVIDGEIVIEPGHHALMSFYGDIFIFNEAEGTWCVYEGEDTPCIDDAFMRDEIVTTIEAYLEAEEAEAEASDTP